MPSAAAEEAEQMLLLGVLDINGQFSMKVDESAIQLPPSVCSITQAFAYLTMYYCNVRQSLGVVKLKMKKEGSGCNKTVF